MDKLLGLLPLLLRRLRYFLSNSGAHHNMCQRTDGFTPTAPPPSPTCVRAATVLPCHSHERFSHNLRDTDRTHIHHSYLLIYFLSYRKSTLVSTAGCRCRWNVQRVPPVRIFIVHLSSVCRRSEVANVAATLLPPPSDIINERARDVCLRMRV